MEPEDKEARRNSVRYGLFLLVIVAFVLAPILLYLATIPLDIPGGIATATVLAIILVAIVAGIAYWGYGMWVERR